jgi:hypothetical protein
MLVLAFILIPVFAFTIACAVSWNLPVRGFGFILIPPVIAFAIACTVCRKWQRKMACLQEKMDRMRGKMSAGGEWWAYPRSGGNRSFDEYRAETLRRLEEEQCEFRGFLDRLRHAKDKAEFDQFIADQFMADRRNRPLSPVRPWSR